MFGSEGMISPMKEIGRGMVITMAIISNSGLVPPMVLK